MPNVSLPSPEIPIEDSSWYIYAQGLFDFVRANRELRLGGILENSTTQQNNSGSSATDLLDYTFEKNQLKTDKDSLSYKIKGTYAANGNNKQIVLSFGSQTIFDTTALAINDGAWIFEVEVTRTGSATQNIFVKAFYNNLSKIAFVSGTQDFTDNINIKLTATGVASSDIVLNEYCFNLNPID